MRVLVALDSFKGAMNSLEAVKKLAQGFLTCQQIAVDLCPLADGGEGTGDIIEHYFHGTRVPENIVDSYGNPCLGWWIRWKRMAVVESSRGSPFVLSMDASRDVRESTSRESNP